jgi:two-component system, LytTR family, response regulator
MLETSMMRPQEVTASVQMARGMRVVLFDPDLETRAKVRTAIDQHHEFVLAGESEDWPGCEDLLDRFVPELLIAKVKGVPLNFLESLSDAKFPVLVGVQGESMGLPTHCGLYDTLRISPELEDIRSLLGRVQCEIYRRKADELSSLLERYLTCAARSGQYLSSLKVEDENQTREIPIERVLLIAADGNYVRVHTESRTYEIRDTMTGISARLDPSRFARLHRSFIVNLSHVLKVVTKDGPAVLVKLGNGMEVPIGPNYREEFEHIVHSQNRLSA